MQLLLQQQTALTENNVVLALELMREADELIAPCDTEDGVTGFFAAGDENQWEPIVQLFNNIPMVQVPAGCFMMGDDAGQSDQQPAHGQCFFAPYWIDQTEVTRAMYAECVAAGVCEPAGDSAASVQDTQPVNRVDWEQAQTYCAWRGLSLSSEAEWEYAARGPADWMFPWGNEFSDEYVVAKTNSAGATVSVGSHPDGASWVGALDMSGNVAEWTRSPYKPYPFSSLADENSDDANTWVARGGDYRLLLSTKLSTTVRVSYWPSFQLDNVGFRCSSESANLPAQLDQTGTCQARIQLAQRLFAAEEEALAAENTGLVLLITAAARDLLTPCSGNVSWVPHVETFNQVEMVEVPSGCFLMGNDAGEIAEQPAHEVCVEEPYWLDKTEVTRVMYAECVAAGACTDTPVSQVSDRDTQPINGVTWFQAADYCAWREARLPTEIEWEYAARGPENWLYPWGNEFVEGNLIYTGRTMADVGSFPAGASWVGALDLSGNAREWVSSLYRDYPYNPDEVEQLDNTSDLRVIRGGAYNTYTPTMTSSAFRSRVSPYLDFDANGFRCARDH